ncbi:MAG TPA: HWE histidine kinase domain-containing protein [Reyranella sp.]|nr:HWE histidine kinase domain-containing protein [Reyranella sp.]
MDKVNILLVDDQPAKLLSYEVILEELGETLIKANTPHEALGVLLKNDVAVVLIDVVMPQIDGFQLAAMIREHPRFEKLAIIFVSGVLIGETDRMRGYEIGAVDYVTVPVVPEVLRAKVKVFIELYRKTRQLEELNAELEARVAARTAELEAQTERLRRSEERRSLALSAGSMGSWEYDPATDHLEWDAGQHRIYAMDERNAPPTRQAILDIVHPDDRDKHPLMMGLATPGSNCQGEFRIVWPDGEVRWCYGSAVITRNTDGKVVRLNGVSIDITERKRTEERQILLAREVDHRAKNTLAVVLSMLRLTKANSTPEFVKALEGRIHALAATHNLLSATHWQGADLRRIVDEELAPYRGAGRGDRVVAEGPAAMLLPATAQSVALALHELATNAAKYGGLSTESGRLRLTWTVDNDAAELVWEESGGPRTTPPSSLGFGLSIVRSSIEAQFRGGVVYEWRPEGLLCRLSIPSAQIVSCDVKLTPAVPATPAPRMMNGRKLGTLAGKRFLVVEDEFLIGMMVKGNLESLGASVSGPYPRLADGIAAASEGAFDGAVLDFNLGGKFAGPLADLLMARGVPFVFITGYQPEGVDRRFASVQILQKPIEMETLERVLRSMFDGSPQPAPVAVASSPLPRQDAV